MVIVSWTTRPSESNLADRDDGTQKKPKKKNYQISVKQYVLHFVKSALPLLLDILADCFVSELALGFTWTPAKSWNLSLKKNNKLLDTAAKVTTNIFNSSLNKPIWFGFILLPAFYDWLRNSRELLNQSENTRPWDYIWWHKSLQRSKRKG